MQAQGLPRGIRRLLGFCGVILIAAACVYIFLPLVVTKTTTEKTAQATKITVEKAEQQSDALIIAAVGFGLILLLTALTDGRFKFSGPGGSGIEPVAPAAVAAAGNAAIHAKDILAAMGEPPPPGPEPSQADVQALQERHRERDPQQRQAVQSAWAILGEWDDLNAKIKAPPQ